MTKFYTGRGFRRLISVALGVLMLIGSTLSLATEGDPFYSDPIDLSELFGGASGDLPPEVILTVVEGLSGLPVNIDDWDYVNVVNMRLQVYIAPLTKGTGRSVALQAPAGLAFGATSLPDGYTYTLSAGNRVATLRFPDDIGAGSSSTLEIPISPNTQATMAQNIGNEIVTRGKAGETDYRFLLTATLGTFTAETYLLPRVYEYENVFTGAPFVGYNKEYYSVQVTGNGLVGEMDTGTKLTFRNEYQLVANGIHEPFWDLTVRYDIPDDFKMNNPALAAYLTEPDGQTIVFPNVNEGGYSASSAANITSGKNRMYSPLADVWQLGYHDVYDESVTFSQAGTAFGRGAVIFGAPLRLEYRNPPAPLVADGGEWALSATATYQTRMGPQSQTFNLPMRTRPWTFSDARITFNTTFAANNARFDLKAGYEGSTLAVGQELRIMSPTNSYNFVVSEKHIGQTMLWEVGDYFDIKAFTLKHTLVAIGSNTYIPSFKIPLTLGSVTYEYIPEGETTPLPGTAVRVGTTNRYEFPDVQDSGHVTKIWFEMPDGLYFLGDAWHHRFDLDVRVAEELPVNLTDPGTYQSSIFVSLPDCTENATKHRTRIDVFLRSPVDLLIGQARGGALTIGNNTANNVTNNTIATLNRNYSLFPNQTGEPYTAQVKQYASLARIGFAYTTFSYSGGLPNAYIHEPSKWMTYENVAIKIAHDEDSRRSLEMIWRAVAGSGLLYTDGYFEYTTAKDPGVIKKTQVVSNGDPVDGTVSTGAAAANFILAMDADDYLTSLTFKAALFKPVGNFFHRREPPLLVSNGAGSSAGGNFAFDARTDRVFPSDQAPIPDWTEEQFAFNCLFSADGVPDREITTFTGMERGDVGFAMDLPRAIRTWASAGTTIVDVPYFSAVSPNENAVAQGSVITVTLCSQFGAAAVRFEDNKVVRNSELWMELGKDFAYAGLAAAPQNLRADMVRLETVNGTQYLVIKEDPVMAITTLTATMVTRNYSFRLMAKPNAKLGRNYLLAGAGAAPVAWTHHGSNAYRDYTDTMNKAYASQFPPYTYAVWSFDSIVNSDASPANDRLWVNESLARAAADFPGRQMFMLANKSVIVTGASESGMRVFPGANNNMAVGTQTFREAQAGNLDGFVTLSAAPLGPLFNAEAIIQIPSGGADIQHSTGTATPDFPLILRGAAAMEDLETDEGETVACTLSYSADGGLTYNAIPGDWASVTHVKLSVPELPKGHGITMHLPLQTAGSFAGIAEGTESYLAGSISFTDGATSQDRPATFTGLATYTPQFGAIQGGYVFVDNNGNHVYDPSRGDVKLAGCTVLLYAAEDLETELDSAVTDANGSYKFDGLLAGNYVTRIVLSGAMATYSFADRGDAANPFASHVDDEGFSPVITLPADRDANLIEKTNAGLVKRLALIYDKGVPASASGMPDPLVTDQLAGAEVEIAAAPGATGYTFIGWMCDVAGCAVCTAEPYHQPFNGLAEELANYYVMPADSALMTAMWIADTLTVTFDKNTTDAVTGPNPASKAVAFDAAYGALAAVSRTGYGLDGWFTAAEGGTLVTAETVVSNANDHTLYARWTANRYDITYAYTGTVPAGAPAEPVADTDVPFGSSKTVAAAPTLVGYTFSGWTTSDVAVSEGAFTMPDKAVAFTGSWTANAGTKYTVEHYKIDGDDMATLADTENLSGTTGATVTATPKSYVGYTCDEGYAGTLKSGAVLGDGSLALKLYYPVNKHNITYTYSGTVPGGAPSAPATESGAAFGAAKAVADAPTMVGYTFSGWTTSDATVSDGSFTMPDKAVAFTGSWTVNTHDITYAYTGTIPAGAPSVPAAELNIASGASKTVAMAPTLTGYAFGGWTTSDAPVSGGSFAMPDNDVTFTGAWNAKGVEVRFYNNHSAGDNTRYAAGDAANAGKKFGETLATFTAPTRTGYDLVGWFTARSGGVEYVPGADIIDTEGPLELYAQWSLKQVEVRFFLNYSPTDNTRYATGDAANAGKLYGDMLSPFADPVRDRHEFVGWFTARSGGVEVVPGAVVLNTEVPLDIYAQWVASYVTIRYRPNDPAMGAVSPSSEELHKTLDAAKGSTAQANPGFIFVNWTDEQGRAVSTHVTFIPAKAAGENIEATYTANFREMDLVTIHYVAREGGTVYPTSSRVNPVTGEPARSTATPAPGYVFVNWTDAQGNVVSTGLSHRPRKADHEVWRDGTTFYANFAIADSGTTITIPVTKVWDVPQGVANLPNVTITLRRDGKPYRTLQLGVGNWSGQFTGVPKTAANGSAYAYTVSENMLPGFTLTSVTGSVEAGFTLTNTARELTVTFVDWNGTLFKQQAVPYGGSATPPDDPTRDGHEFAGWIGRYENVTRNEYVYAKYRRAGEGFFSLLDAAVPLAGGAVSNFGDCVE